jgi:ElaB/YqjD/DUF883 family membrane-anchored ribosome-binding protein
MEGQIIPPSPFFHSSILPSQPAVLIFPGATQKVGSYSTSTESQPIQRLRENIMDEHQDSQEAADSAKDHVKSAADDFKAAASAKAEEIRRAAEQKADELRHAAEDKARELRGAAESVWSDARSKAKTWQSDSETYIRENPTKAILIALGLGFFLGLMFRK